MCNKHRKWVEKGYIDLGLNQLKPLKEVPNYKKARCKVEDCDNPVRKRFFCLPHYSSFRSGVIDENGKRLKPKVRYSKDFGCIKCGARGKITKGFCKKHYNQLRLGLIDFNGNELRDRKRMVYHEFSRCKVSGCKVRPRIRGFCSSHADSKKKGYYDEDGNRLVPFLSKNAGKNCLRCDRPAVIKLHCNKHHYQVYKAKPRVMINKGKVCAAIACGRNAVCKGLCEKHYARRKRRLELEKMGACVERPKTVDCKSIAS
jgi:hypothetical protein